MVAHKDNRVFAERAESSACASSGIRPSAHARRNRAQRVWQSCAPVLRNGLKAKIPFLRKQNELVGAVYDRPQSATSWAVIDRPYSASRQSGLYPPLCIAALLFF